MYPTHYIFNHVAKTGGTSLLSVCRHNLPPSDISPHLTEEAVLWTDLRLEQYRLLNGHFSLLAQSRFARSRFTMTLVRDPIRTALSVYRFWRNTTESNPIVDKAKELSMRDFVTFFKRAPSVLNNRLTFHFAAVPRDFPGDLNDGKLLLAAAKKNLAAFDFVGVCEHFERSAKLLCAILGWQPPSTMPHENRSGEDHELSTVDPQVLHVLQQCNDLDVQLYAFAVELFKSRERDGSAVPQLASLSAESPDKRDVNSSGESFEVERNCFTAFSVPSAPLRKAYIRSVHASWLADRGSPVVEVSVEFEVRAQCPELIVGVMLLDGFGNTIWATNTFIEKCVLEVEAGRTYSVCFILECSTTADRYFVTAALHNLRNAGLNYHWVDRAALFEAPGESAVRRDTPVRLIELRHTASS